jgi:hypothetical protein
VVDGSSLDLMSTKTVKDDTQQQAGRHQQVRKFFHDGGSSSFHRFFSDFKTESCQRKNNPLEIFVDRRDRAKNLL